MGGSVLLSTGVVTVGEASSGGVPPEARARSAGGLYLPPSLSSACNSLALDQRIRKKSAGREFWTYLLANAAEGAGGGVFPEVGTLE